MGLFPHLDVNPIIECIYYSLSKQGNGPITSERKKDFLRSRFIHFWNLLHLFSFIWKGHLSCWLVFIHCLDTVLFGNYWTKKYDELDFWAGFFYPMMCPVLDFFCLTSFSLLFLPLFSLDIRDKSSCKNIEEESRVLIKVFPLFSLGKIFPISITVKYLLEWIKSMCFQHWRWARVSEKEVFLVQ